MPFLFHRFEYFLKHWLLKVDRHSLHAPFLYDLFEYIQHNLVISNQASIEAYRNELRNNHSIIQTSSPGTSSTISPKRDRKISEIARLGVTSKRYSQILYKVGSFVGAKSIIELGTSFGLNTMYLASIAEAQVFTIEGCENTAEIAQKGFDNLGFNNIYLIRGNIDSELPELLHQQQSWDLAYVDANHTYLSTITYFELLFRKSHPGSVLILDDIYWSPEMTKAWIEIKKDERVSLTLDLFQMGIVFFNTDLLKQNVILDL